ncbi:hypothetical protein MKW98_026846, partial [Papaver atlanticum]
RDSVSDICLGHSSSILIRDQLRNDKKAMGKKRKVVYSSCCQAFRESGKLNKDAAATKIQTAFRCYLARMALRALRVARLKTLMDGQSVKRQATTTLRYMQTLSRVQSQIRGRRIRMSEENQALQKKLQQKHEKELETMKASMGDDWDVSAQSKEQLEAKQIHKQEAAMKGKELAYAFTHQQTLRNSGKAGNPTFMDPNNPHWDGVG